MSTNHSNSNTILIRLTPRRIKNLRTIISAFADHPAIAQMVGLGSEEIAAAKETLMHIPSIGPAMDANNTI